MKRLLLLSLILSMSFSLSGCDFISTIMDMFSSGAGGAAAEATTEAVGGEAGKKMGSVAGSFVKETVQTKGTEYLNNKKSQASDTGTTEKTEVKVGGD